MTGMHPSAAWVDQVIAETSEAQTLVVRGMQEGVSLARLSGPCSLENEEHRQSAAHVRGRLFVVAGFDLLRTDLPQGAERQISIKGRNCNAELIYTPVDDGWMYVVNVGKDPLANRPEAKAFFDDYRDFYLAYMVSGLESNLNYRHRLIDHLVSHPQEVNRFVCAQLLREEALDCQQNHGVSQAFLELSGRVARQYPDLFAEMAASLCLACFDVYMALRSLSLPEMAVAALRREHAVRLKELTPEKERELQLLAELISVHG